MITDLFSHKIHSSLTDWQEKLIDIASIFNEFDGQPFDRDTIEKKFQEISPRVSGISRDPSKFRDEISAYPTYLGLYRIESINDKWHIFTSNTTKKLLINDEPNVPLFLLLQLILFQYPNGMGAVYKGHKSVRLQTNAAQRTLSFIEKNIHFSPLRMIFKALTAKALYLENDLFNIHLSFDEVFLLANDPRTNQVCSPSIDSIIEVLDDFNNKKVFPPSHFENRFHLLKHLDIFILDKSYIKIRKPLNQDDQENITNLINTTNNITNQFNNFDNINSIEELTKEIRKGSWGLYFDGIKKINYDFIDQIKHYDKSQAVASINTIDVVNLKSEKIYDLSLINFTSKKTFHDNNKIRPIADFDLEAMAIKRQKANLWHRITLEKLYNFFKEKNILSLENEHIDLYTKLDKNLNFIFEIKSITEENLLSQTRKAMSQLYEYRFRYKKILGEEEVHLCIVYQKEPKTISWLQEYICTDRNIGILWFENEELKSSKYNPSFIKALF